MSLPERVAENAYYTILYDYDKNRFYLTVRGFWSSPSLVPDYVNDWRKAMLVAKSGFTLLTDATQVKTYPPSVVAIHEEAQQVVVNAGLYRVAEVLPKSAFIEFQSDLMSEHSEMPCAKFNDFAMAESWLDQKMMENKIGA